MINTNYICFKQRSDFSSLIYYNKLENRYIEISLSTFKYNSNTKTNIYNIMKKFLLIVLMFAAVSGNAQWVLQNTGSTTDFHSVKFINKNTGWICGTGVIAKTTNAGLNWVQQTHPATNKRLDCLSVVDSNTVY